MPCSQNTSSQSNAHGNMQLGGHARTLRQQPASDSKVQCDAPAKAAFPPESSCFCLTAVSRNGLHMRSFLADALICSMTFYEFYASGCMCVTVCVCVCVCVCVHSWAGAVLIRDFHGPAALFFCHRSILLESKGNDQGKNLVSFFSKL